MTTAIRPSPGPPHQLTGEHSLSSMSYCQPQLRGGATESLHRKWFQYWKAPSPFRAWRKSRPSTSSQIPLPVSHESCEALGEPPNSATSASQAFQGPRFTDFPVFGLDVDPMTNLTRRLVNSLALLRWFPRRLDLPSGNLPLIESTHVQLCRKNW